MGTCSENNLAVWFVNLSFSGRINDFIQSEFFSPIICLLLHLNHETMYSAHIISRIAKATHSLNYKHINDYNTWVVEEKPFSFIHSTLYTNRSIFFRKTFRLPFCTYYAIFVLLNFTYFHSEIHFNILLKWEKMEYVL